MGTHCHLILLIVLIDHHLITTYWCKRNTILLVQTPTVKFLSQFFRIKLVRGVLDSIWVIIISINILALAIFASIRVRSSSSGTTLLNYFTSLQMLEKAFMRGLNIVFTVEMRHSSPDRWCCNTWVEWLICINGRLFGWLPYLRHIFHFLNRNYLQILVTCDRWLYRLGS